LAYLVAKDTQRADTRSVVNASNALRMLLWHGIEPTLKKRANIAIITARIIVKKNQRGLKIGEPNIPIG